MRAYCYSTASFSILRFGTSAKSVSCVGLTQFNRIKALTSLVVYIIFPIFEGNSILIVTQYFALILSRLIDLLVAINCRYHGKIKGDAWKHLFLHGGLHDFLSVCGRQFCHFLPSAENTPENTYFFTCPSQVFSRTFQYTHNSKLGMATFCKCA